MGLSFEGNSYSPTNYQSIFSCEKEIFEAGIGLPAFHFESRAFSIQLNHWFRLHTFAYLSYPIVRLILKRGLIQLLGER